MLTNSSSIPTLMVQLQARYPTASLTAEFVTIHQDHFVVRALVQVGGITLTTCMAAATDIEQAEDRAKIRVLSALGISGLTSSAQSHHAAYSPSAPPVFAPSTDFAAPESRINSTSSVPSEVTSNLSTSVSTPPLKPLSLTGLPQAGVTTSVLSSTDQSLTQPLSVTNSSADFTVSPPIEDDRMAYEFSYEPEESQPETYNQPEDYDAEGYSAKSYSAESYDPKSYDTENYEFTSSTLPKVEAISESISPSPETTDPTLTASTTSTSPPIPASSTPAPAKSTSSGKAKTAKRKSENPETAVPSSAGENDRSEEIAKIGLEMKRLGWTTEQGRNYLKRTYGKRSRQELDDSELIDFLRYLEAQVSPSESLF